MRFLAPWLAHFLLGKRATPAGRALRQAKKSLVSAAVLTRLYCCGGLGLLLGPDVVGILATLLILIPLFNVDPMAATLIEIAFEGGHGTAGGMVDTLVDLGFTDGPDLAVGLATVGIGLIPQQCRRP